MESSDLDKYVLSVGNYEGGLLGLSFKNKSEALQSFNTEYAFTSV